MATLFEPIQPKRAARSSWLDHLTSGTEFRPDARFQRSASGPVDGGAVTPETSLSEPDAYQLGFADGQAAMQADLSEQLCHEQRLQLELKRIDSAMRENLEQRLSHIVAQLCEASIAPHMLDTEKLQERCAKAIALLDAHVSDSSFRMHPADAELLNADFKNQWTVKSDPLLERGTIRLCKGDAELADGPQQWRAAIAEAIDL